jgi:hypothetical protein
MCRQLTECAQNVRKVAKNGSTNGTVNNLKHLNGVLGRCSRDGHLRSLPSFKTPVSISKHVNGVPGVDVNGVRRVENVNGVPGLKNVNGGSSAQNLNGAPVGI